MVYKLFLSYLDLAKDDSDFKDDLAKIIHELIAKKLNEIKEMEDIRDPNSKTKVRIQLDLLFQNDPYYIYSCKERDPKIFSNINIYELKNEQDIKYFQDKNLEKVYWEKFCLFLDTLIGKIVTINDFIGILKIIVLNDEENKNEYINKLETRCDKFKEQITNETFIIFF